MKNEGSTSKPSLKTPAEAPARKNDATPSPSDSPSPLDFSKLDLTIDRVDERLSPSETNIFDK